MKQHRRLPGGARPGSRTRTSSDVASASLKTTRAQPEKPAKTAGEETGKRHSGLMLAKAKPSAARGSKPAKGQAEPQERHRVETFTRSGRKLRLRVAERRVENEKPRRMTLRWKSSRLMQSGVVGLPLTAMPSSADTDPRRLDASTKLKATRLLAVITRWTAPVALDGEKPQGRGSPITWL